MWLVAKTKSNQEKKAEFNLNNQGFTTFLPIHKRKKFYKNHWVNTENYLFRGYIFINADDVKGKYSKINNTFGISKILIDSDTFSPYLLDDSVIEDIIKRLEIYHSGNSDITKNDRVEITSGLHNELVGIFVEDISTNRSKMLINILKRNREVVVNKADIQLVY